MLHLWHEMTRISIAFIAKAIFYSLNSLYKKPIIQNIIVTINM